VLQTIHQMKVILVYALHDITGLVGCSYQMSEKNPLHYGVNIKNTIISATHIKNTWELMPIHASK